MSKETTPKESDSYYQDDEFCPQPHRQPLMTPDSYSVPKPEIIEEGPSTSEIVNP